MSFSLSTRSTRLPDKCLLFKRQRWWFPQVIKRNKYWLILRGSGNCYMLLPGCQVDEHSLDWFSVFVSCKENSLSMPQCLMICNINKLQISSSVYLSGSGADAMGMKSSRSSSTKKQRHIHWRIKARFFWDLLCGFLNKVITCTSLVILRRWGVYLVQLF